MHPRQLPNRRQAIGVLLAAALPMHIAQAEDDDIGMVEFVRARYVRQVAMHAAGEPMRGDAFYPLFASKLRALMQAPRPGLAREPVGRILNAFFG